MDMMSRQEYIRRRIFNFKCMFQILLILGTVSSTDVSECCECPPPCVCKWIMGKKTAICISAGFTKIPNLDQEIHVLNLNNNHITRLEADSFRSVGLTDLQKIFMRNVTLLDIHPDAFKNMTILVEVNLADNHLNTIPAGAFEGNVRLKTLILSGNPLRTLSGAQFPSLPCLRTLELEACQLHYMEEETFANLNALEILNLKLNNLQSVSRAMFANLTSLKSLSLEGNPWRCDCHLRQFRDWYLSSSLLSLSPICYEPEIFQYKLWTGLDSDDFSCTPDVYISDGDVVYREIGDNLTLNCNVNGDSESKVTWLFNGLPVVALFNGSYNDNVSVKTESDGFENIWSTLNVKRLSEYNFGSYKCLAKSTIYLVEAGVLVKLPLEEPIVQAEIGRSHAFWFLFTGVSILGLVLFVITTSAVACGCMTYTRKKKREMMHVARFSDPEKHLLDTSKSSCEKLEDTSGCDFPRYSGNLHVRKPLNSGQYVTAIPVQPVLPPKEFTMARSRTLGSVYQSECKGPHYRSKPNLSQDLVNRVKNDGTMSNNKKVSSSVSDVSLLPFATLPRKQYNFDNLSTFAPKYDNMGKRVSVRGSSTLSFHDIPPPPPAPSATNPDYDFVPL